MKKKENTTLLISWAELSDYLLKGKPFNPKPMKSKYKNVYRPVPRGAVRKREWCARIKINGVEFKQFYETEKEAAIAIDKILIKHGKEPVNVLLRK